MATNFGLDLEISFALRQMIPGGLRTLDVLGPNTPFRTKLRSGTGYGNIDVGFFRVTGGNPAATAIAASGNLDIDVVGALTDVYGTTLLNATKLIALYVANFNTAGTLTVRHASATTVPLFVNTGTQPGQIIQAAHSATDPGQFFVYAPDGFTVAAGSTDKFNLLNNDSSNAANYAVGFAARTV